MSKPLKAGDKFPEVSIVGDNKMIDQLMFMLL